MHLNHHRHHRSHNHESPSPYVVRCGKDRSRLRLRWEFGARKGDRRVDYGGESGSWVGREGGGGGCAGSGGWRAGGEGKGGGDGSDGHADERGDAR
jgi:hypothetical protein